MIRRIAHAMATLAVAATATLAWAQPAQAAPAKPCSVEEWRNPTKFVECGRRARAALGQQMGCVTAPTPGSPTSGMAGWFTSRAGSSLRSGVSGYYSRYGVGGYGLDTYDLGCLGTVKHPDLVAWNTAATAQFTAAASVLGIAHGLRERAYDPGSMWGWSDSFVDAAVSAAYRYVFHPFGAVSIMALGLYLLWRAPQGQMAKMMQMAGWAVFVTVLVTAVARYPLVAAHGADSAAKNGLTVMHRVFGPAPQHVPADQCLLASMDPESCQDHRSVAVRSADVATDAVIYRAWLRAMLGSADSSVARQYGPALYDATTMTWEQAAAAEKDPNERKRIIAEKSDNFHTVAEQVRHEDPNAYEHLQGTHGADRFGAGVVALLGAVMFSAFDVAASIVILFGFLVFRVAIVLLPVLGVIGIFQPASAGLRRIFHMTAAAIANIVMFGAGAGLYLTFVDLVFRSPLPGVAQLNAVALLGVASFLVLHPVRQLVSTATGRSRAKDGLVTRLFKAGQDIRTAASASPPASGGGAHREGSVPRQRPEAESTLTPGAVVKTVVAAAAPTPTAAAAAAAVHPWVTTAVAAVSARQRPEAAVGRPASSTSLTGPAAPSAADRRPETRS